jgi:CheY-like chemotaxis protein
MSAEKKTIVVLIAEDDRDDQAMTREAFEESRVRNDIHFVEDGEQLLQYLRHEGAYTDSAAFPRPGLILLDLNMPRMGGRAALKEIKADTELRHIPVIVMTTSKAEEDIFRSYDEGAASFITKPVRFGALVDIIRSLGRYWLEIVELPEEK